MKHIFVIPFFVILITSLILNFSTTVYSQGPLTTQNHPRYLNQAKNHLTLQLLQIGDVMKMPKQLQKISKARIQNSLLLEAMQVTINLLVVGLK